MEWVPPHAKYFTVFSRADKIVQYQNLFSDVCVCDITLSLIWRIFLYLQFSEFECHYEITKINYKDKQKQPEACNFIKKRDSGTGAFL